ncbi:MAG TPA: hypothetical protein VIL74_19825 [Pyrinomonadaceae bacterium]|jgi:hypothetical protein
MKSVKNRQSEKGAVMVMVVMISLLLLAAVGGLLLEVSMNTANVSDATAEQQAYNAAESGIQSSINVLRGNVKLDPSKPASDPVNEINFRKAVTVSTSNKSGDSSTVARLSRWINYNYTPDGASLADRVTLNPLAEYEPEKGYAFGVTVSDPDNTGNIISYKVTGRLYHPVQKKWTSSPVTVNGVTISYSAPATSPITLNVASGHAVADYGSFKFTGTGSIPEDVRFEIVVDMIAPYTVSRGVRGYIKAKTGITAANLNTIVIDFDSKVSQLMGSTITLDNDPMTPNVGGTAAVKGDMTQAEPFRLVLTSIGYGPRGAKKVLEATIQKNFFNGMTAPATLMLVGPKSKNGVNAVFEPGSSSVTQYSGQDVVSSVIIPPIGTTNDDNLDTVLAKTDGNPPHPFNGKIVGTSANVDSEMPFWLQNPSNLNSTVEALKLTAKKSGTFYENGQTPSVVGDNTTARGLTFVDGDLELNPTMGGGGILVVTGKLTLKGNFNFNGMILVTGAEGVVRKGGGNGTLQGNVVVAPYKKDDLDAGFLPPKYDLSGGGNSGVIYNSSSVANGMVAVSNFVLAVAEK